MADIRRRKLRLDYFLFVLPDLFTIIPSRWPVPFRLVILPLRHPSDMRRDVQEIFRATPHHKQVMMFSATLAKDIRVTCKKFMANVRGSTTIRVLCFNQPRQPLEIFVDDETKLTLHGLQQHYVKLEEVGKNRKLNDLLDTLEFNQVDLLIYSSFIAPQRAPEVVIFVKSVARAIELDKLLVSCNFPSISIHSGLAQEERYVDDDSFHSH